MTEENNMQIGFAGLVQPLHPEGVQIEVLKGSLYPDSHSAQGRHFGRQLHPINFRGAKDTMLAVNIQQTCIQTKRDATVGLGFESEKDRMARMQDAEMQDETHRRAMQPPVVPPPKPAAAVRKAVETAQAAERSKVSEILDPLCEISFQSLLDQVGEDYENTGNGYIEVVRDGGRINSLWHIPAESVYVFYETQRPHFHYEVDDTSGTLKFAKAGDLDGFTARNPNIRQPVLTELLHFRKPTSYSRCYGLPNWLATTPWLELAQVMLQYHFDYFQNRAVPDLLALLLGRKMPPKEFESFRDALKSTKGPGKRFGTLAVNIPDPEMKVQIERLTADNREGLSDLWSAVELGIVSGHRVPPLLAGIITPGKMAAANELPNALVAFQTLYVAQQQGVFQDVLRNFFPKEGLGLEADDFTLRKITDFFDIGQVDTMSRMRETAAEASANGRNLADGLKE